jgi:hypothetical protein
LTSFGCPKYLEGLVAVELAMKKGMRKEDNERIGIDCPISYVSIIFFTHA